MLKNIIVIIVLAVTLIAFGQQRTDLPTPSHSAGKIAAGEHTPVIFTGIDTVRGTANPCTTAWMLIGSSPNASTADNRNIGWFNPEHFTIAMKLSTVQGDTAQIGGAKFESIYDTTSTPFWNGDSSNTFIKTDAYSHELYGQWKFEPFQESGRYYLFPLRLLVGGYTRMIFETDVDDTLQVDWKLICEH